MNHLRQVSKIRHDGKTVVIRRICWLPGSPLHGYLNPMWVAASGFFCHQPCRWSRARMCSQTSLAMQIPIISWGGNHPSMGTWYLAFPYFPAWYQPMAIKSPKSNWIPNYSNKIQSICLKWWSFYCPLGGLPMESGHLKCIFLLRSKGSPTKNSIVHVVGPRPLFGRVVWCVFWHFSCRVICFLTLFRLRYLCSRRHTPLAVLYMFVYFWGWGVV